MYKIPFQLQHTNDVTLKCFDELTAEVFNYVKNTKVSLSLLMLDYNREQVVQKVKEDIELLIRNFYNKALVLTNNSILTYDYSVLDSIKVEISKDFDTVRIIPCLKSMSYVWYDSFVEYLNTSSIICVPKCVEKEIKQLCLTTDLKTRHYVDSGKTNPRKEKQIFKRIKYLSKIDKYINQINTITTNNFLTYPKDLLNEEVQ